MTWKPNLYHVARQGLSPEHLGQLVAIWHDGIVRQFCNIPVDMRIERWLYEEYSGLCTLQRTALRQQARENAKVLRRRVRTFTPEKVYHANAVMNAAYSAYLASFSSHPE